MAYVTCSKCYKLVNDKAPACPFCGAAMNKAPEQIEAPQREARTDGLCDICNRSIIVAQAHIVKTDLIRRATARGYLPPIAKAIGNDFAAMGLTGKVMWENTIQAGASTDWALCDSCYNDIVGHSMKTGCFIATAACWTPDAWEVITLSRFRDEVLNVSAAGKALVRLYYQVSPRLAAVIAKHWALRLLVRNLIVRPNAVIARLWLGVVHRWRAGGRGVSDSAART